MFDPQFTVDAELAPTFTLKNYNATNKTFEIHFKSPELKKDSYMVTYDISNLKGEEEEPLLFQVAQIVFWEVEKLKKEEMDKRGLIVSLTSMLNTEMSVSPTDMNRHREKMFKKNVHTVDPTLNLATVVNVHSEEDFNQQFEEAIQ